MSKPYVCRKQISIVKPGELVQILKRLKSGNFLVKKAYRAEIGLLRTFRIKALNAFLTLLMSADR